MIDIRISPALLTTSDLSSVLADARFGRVWVELGPLDAADTLYDIARASEKLAERAVIIPVASSLDIIMRIIDDTPTLRSLAIKGNEAGGFVGTETTLSLLCAARTRLKKTQRPLDVFVWGGIGTPEAAAGLLIMGVKGIVFETVHCLTDLPGLNPDLRDRIRKLRPEHTEIVGGGLGVPVRLFNKGNSAIVKNLEALSHRLLAAGTPDQARRAFVAEITHCAVQLRDSALGPEEAVPLGVEIAFAQQFVERFGKETGAALRSFLEAIYDSYARALRSPDSLKNSPSAKKLGVRYPIIQGAMSWITDEPLFAKAVAEAGALPTIALGVLDPKAVEEKLARLHETMQGRPFAVNIVTLPDNPYREFHFDWVLKTRPRFVVIAAGDPSHASRFLEEGIEVIYVTPNPELMKLAFDLGVKFVVCEGNEAGGHVGANSTLTLAQKIIALRHTSPALFEGKTVALAGGIYDRDTAFFARVLAADAIQVGTAYLATREIVSTGALSPLYQKRILEAQPGDTAITGEAAGLRVRSLRSPKICTLLDLERQFVCGAEPEESFRRKIETLTAGSLYVAAKGRDITGTQVMTEDACKAEGQFMSGVVAGFLERELTLTALHEELVSGPSAVATDCFAAGHRETQSQGQSSKGATSREPSSVHVFPPKPASRSMRERIAITGMSVANSLGVGYADVIRASLAKKSGITAVPRSRWDHTIYFDPRPRVPEKTYCSVGAFMDVHISRKDLGVAPHDFRTMTGATRITLLLAEQAIQESGILSSDIPRERISVLISQNSGEAAGTLQDMIVRGSADAIGKAAIRALALEPSHVSELEKEVKKGRLAVDDTTLLGRLNCAAGGFICNKYGFMGPSFAVSAACATSLAALFTAIQFIRNGLIDAAIVGGGEEFLSPMHFLEFSALGALAGISGVERPPSTTSRPFDRDRDGMVLGEGGGMLVIERESTARKRGARIHAFITGVGASNNHLGMVESSSQTQELAISSSFRDAPYGPDEVDFVECHATGTKQGDIEEVRALRKFFRRRTGPVLSSFKSQIGHTLGASGINSLIRGVSAMNEGLFPPTLNHEQPDSELAIEESGMVLLGDPDEWRRRDGLPRRMQVNAFGFGGSNYVVQVEEALDGKDKILVDPSTRTEAQPRFSAPKGDSASSLKGLVFFEGTLSGVPYRVAVLADDEDTARAFLNESDLLRNGPTLAPKRIRSLAKQGIYAGPINLDAENIAFVFPGQGSHYAGMGRELYENFPVIRNWMDRAADVAEFDLLRLLFHDREEDLQKTRWQQPALFTLEYAVAQYLLSLGVSPKALAGHSLGELTALCLAGVYSFEDGFRLVNKRAVCMDKACSQGVDPGVMLACDAPADVLDDILKRYPNTFITNVNSPKQVVLGGASDAMRALGLELKTLGFRSTLLRVSMAFHSPIMRCIRDELEEFVSRIEFYPPTMPVVSNTTGQPFPDDPSQIKRILMDHLESPVLWMQDINILTQQFDITCFVEVGPREILCNLIQDTVEGVECIQTCLPSAELLVFKTALARLYAKGHLNPPDSPLPLDAGGHASPVGDIDQTRIALPARPDAARTPHEQIQSIIQKHVNAFILESFGRFIKPAVLKSVRETIDPTYTEEQLESFLGQASSAQTVEPVRDASALLMESVTTPPPTGSRSDEADIAEKATTSGALDETDVTERVIRLIMEATGYERNEIEPDMDLREDLSIRSSRLPVIMDAVEGHFGIKIELEDFMDVRTIRDISSRIAMVMVRQQGAHEGQTSAPLRPLAHHLDHAVDSPRQTIKRVIFRERSIEVETAELNPVEITPTEPLLIISAKGGTGLRRSIGDVFRRDYGATILTGQFLSREKDQELFAVDLRKEGQTSEALSAMEQIIEPPSGLVIVLDQTLGDELHKLEDVPVVLGGLFEILKTFLQSSSKKFALVVENRSHEPSAPMLTLQEGLLGVLLSASLELGYVLFRSLTVHQDSDLTKAIRWALNRAIKPVHLMCNAAGVYAAEGRVAPLEEFGGGLRGLEPSDVIVFSGGGYGVTSRLARSLELYGCKIVLLGRTPIDDQEPPSKSYDQQEFSDATMGAEELLAQEKGQVQSTRGADLFSTACRVRETIQYLESRGIEVSYYSCDVTDPQAVKSVFAQIYQTHGRIDGVVHGAGILRDNLIKSMDAEDFRRVVEVKLLGAWNLLQALGENPIKFFACLSSAACIQGNPGQSNYAAGNRMMSALLSYFMRQRPETICKSFMLPPIEGTGMADTPEIRALMKRAHTDYIHVDEFAVLFWRELFLSPRENAWVLYMRSLPDLKTAPIELAESHDEKDFLRVHGMAIPRDRAPLIDTVQELDLRAGSLKASRRFSTDRDLWIEDHKPFVFLRHPLLSAVMVIEAMLEACRIVYPLLEVIAVKDVWFFDVIECPPHSEQEVIIECATVDRKGGHIVCGAQMFTRPQETSLRPARTRPHYKGVFVLAPHKERAITERVKGSHSSDVKLTEPISRSEVLAQYELRSAMKDRYRVIDSISGFGEGTISAATVYKHSVDFADLPDAKCQYSPYLLEALMQSANFYLVARGDATNAAIIPYRVEDLIFTRNCKDGEVIAVEGRLLKEDRDGLEWEAWAVDEAGETIMYVKKATFRWFSLPDSAQAAE
ncbi:MAG: SDR family NAD(P)-dependent oxidoreductase [Desulfomonilaceae bacterium]